MAPRTPEEEQQRSDSPSDWRLSDVVSSGSSRDQNAAAAAGEGRSQFATEHGVSRAGDEGFKSAGVGAGVSSRGGREGGLFLRSGDYTKEVSHSRWVECFPGGGWDILLYEIYGIIT